MPIEKGESLQKLWKRCGVFLGCLGLAGFIWTAGLRNRQLNTLPRSADPVEGRIYSRNIHGIVVFQTRSERDYLDRVQNASIAVFVMSIVLSLIYKKKWGAQRAGPSKIGTIGAQNSLRAIALVDSRCIPIRWIVLFYCSSTQHLGLETWDTMTACQSAGRIPAGGRISLRQLQSLSKVAIPLLVSAEPFQGVQLSG